MRDIQNFAATSNLAEFELISKNSNHITFFKVISSDHNIVSIVLMKEKGDNWRLREFDSEEEFAMCLGRDFLEEIRTNLAAALFSFNPHETLDKIKAAFMFMRQICHLHGVYDDFYSLGKGDLFYYRNSKKILDYFHGTIKANGQMAKEIIEGIESSSKAHPVIDGTTMLEFETKVGGLKFFSVASEEKILKLLEAAKEFFDFASIQDLNSDQILKGVDNMINLHMAMKKFNPEKVISAI